MRTPMIAGNWKMNTTVSEALKLVREMHGGILAAADVDRVVCPAGICLGDLEAGLEAITSVDKVICPPFVSLAPVREIIKGSSIKLGAQNLYFEEKGAYTGEISPLMLAELCEFVILGHSERRQYFNETNEVVNKKIKAALKVGLKPILCVGERLEDNEAGRTEEVVGEQLTLSLAGIGSLKELTVAYEPVWAIGTGRAASGQQANQTIGFIRRSLGRLYTEAAAEEVRILYGGSVNADNTVEFMDQPEIDGALVGGASLKADQFISITKLAATLKSSE
ncbi:MAG: triose-phosphate isomerase [Dehalococcoidales bacterium]|nr:triose-phosphate isomerase [Dehalococcoidales bacterium]